MSDPNHMHEFMANRLGLCKHYVNGGLRCGQIAEAAPHTRWAEAEAELTAAAQTQGDWPACVRAANRIMDLVYAIHHPGDARARELAPTCTISEIIAMELGITIP